MVIDGSNICFSYEYGEAPALNDLSFSVEKGELLAILGRNGSGKSTLVKLYNALLPLQDGKLYVMDIDVRDENEIWRLRRLCGMVFQDPNNQFVSSVVAEDIAFGLENYEVPRSEIDVTVAEALTRVSMDGFENRSPHTLSGGQKQRVALAGALALHPEILVLDEVTAMLDPEGRDEVLGIIRQLHAEKCTIIMITHYVEEAVFAGRVLLMNNGKILADGTPRDIMTDRTLMAQAELIPPVPVRLYYDLLDAGIPLCRCPLTREEFADEICRLN